MRLLLTVLAVTLLLAVVQGATIRGRVEVGDILSAPLSIRLDAFTYTFVRKDGTFTFRNIPDGAHELQVVDPMRWYSKVIVVVEHDSLTKIVELSPPQQPNAPPMKRILPSVLLHPIGTVDYFEKRQQMTLASLFANPMLLMMMVTLGLGFIMPKLMENIDPEELRLAQEQIAGTGKGKSGAAIKQE